MKKPSILCTLAMIIASCAGYSGLSHQSRDLSYERHCDSIWAADPDYYVDVLAETEQYQEYVERHGSWWKED